MRQKWVTWLNAHPRATTVMMAGLGAGVMLAVGQLYVAAGRT